MDIAAANWSEDDNANTVPAPDGAPEGMAPSGVNNVLRAHQGALKRFYNWTIPKITGGSSAGYTLSYSVAPGALIDGMTHLVQFHTANAAGATLNVNALGALPIHYHAAGAWRVAPPALIDTDEIWRVAYHTSSGTYRLPDLRNRTGEVVPFAGSSAPAGALFCYGQALSRTTYAGLFATLGTTHGSGDGSATFNLPDMRGLVAAGKDDMGGSNANRLSAYIASTALGAAGGSQGQGGIGVSVSVGVVVSGTLTGSAGGFDGSFVAAAVSGDGAAPRSHTHPNVSVSGSLTGAGSGSGSTGTIPTVQPTRILNYLIRI